MISKERFEQIAKQISSDMSKEPFSEVVWTSKSKLEFAHALIKAVEKESEVVGYEYRCDKLIALPLVSEE